MLQLNKTKNVLERLSILMTTRQMSGMGMLSELQEIGDMASAALDELYQAEIDAERTNSPLRRLEAMGKLRVQRRQGARRMKRQSAI